MNNLISFLKNHGVLNRLEEQFDPAFQGVASNFADYSVRMEVSPKAIDHALEWDHTNEGGSFWFDISHKWQEELKLGNYNTTRPRAFDFGTEITL